MGASCIDDCWLGRPLCRGYRIAVFATAQVAVRLDDGPQGHRIGWALGFLPNTEAEVLGLWAQPDADAVVMHDLHERGVERIAMVIDAGWPSAASEALSAYPRARAAPSTEHFVRRVTAPLPRRLRGAVTDDLRAAFAEQGGAALLDAVRSAERSAARRARTQEPVGVNQALRLRAALQTLPEEARRFVLAADRTASVLLEELARAVQRNGYFLNRAAAIEFLANTLQRAERRMGRERAAAAGRGRLLRAAAESRLAGSRAV